MVRFDDQKQSIHSLCGFSLARRNFWLKPSNDRGWHHFGYLLLTSTRQRSAHSAYYLALRLTSLRSICVLHHSNDFRAASQWHAVWLHLSESTMASADMVDCWRDRARSNTLLSFHGRHDLRQGWSGAKETADFRQRSDCHLPSWICRRSARSIVPRFP